jgi:hypothetical protein
VNRILVSLACAAVLLAACGSGTTAPVIPTSSGQGPPVAILRLFDSTGADISGHIKLDSGQTDRVEVRLYAADGTTRITGGVTVALSFDPPSYAQAVPIDTLFWLVTPSAQPLFTFGNLFVTVTPDASTTTGPKFGPFQMLTHPFGS